MSDELTTPQAILTILGPVGTFVAGCASVLLKRHLGLIDKVEKRMEGDAAVLVEVALEMKLNREARESVIERLGALEVALGEKIEGKRLQGLEAAIERISAPGTRPPTLPPEEPPSTGAIPRRSRTA